MRSPQGQPRRRRPSRVASSSRNRSSFSYLTPRKPARAQTEPLGAPREVERLRVAPHDGDDARTRRPRREQDKTARFSEGQARGQRPWLEYERESSGFFPNPGNAVTPLIIEPASARLADVGGQRDTDTSISTYAESKVSLCLWGRPSGGPPRKPGLRPHPRSELGAGRRQLEHLDQDAAGIVTILQKWFFCLQDPFRGTCSASVRRFVPRGGRPWGAVWTEGPRVRLMNLKAPSYFSEANPKASFAAVNAALATTGRTCPL